MIMVNDYGLFHDAPGMAHYVRRRAPLKVPYVFNKVSLREIDKVQNLVNGRPRKILDFSTPHEVFVKLLH